ncbi:MAG: Uncharacterised protein [uncultured Bacteroidota bacterium]|nr:MAG: Uncharacterised protein [uncultured Bacteroidetes bacterium]
MSKLEIFGRLREISWGPIPEDQINTLQSSLEDEFDRDDFEDILDQNNETGIGQDLDLQILVDGNVMKFDPNDYKSILEKPKIIEDQNTDKSYLIEETFSKGSVYECNFDGVFDPKKLHFHSYKYLLGETGQTIDIVEIDYDNIECEDRNAEVKEYSIKVLKADGSYYE